VDDFLAGVQRGIDVFDCAVPTRLARHGVALAPLPDKRWRLDVRKPDNEGDRRPLVEGCDCPACAAHDRDYLNYLSRSQELTAVRLITMHNLTYMQRLAAASREQIAAGSFDAFSSAVLDGATPWDA